MRITCNLSTLFATVLRIDRMRLDETLSRVRSVRRGCRQGPRVLSRRTSEARSGVSKTAECKPAEKRPEAKGQSLRFGPRSNRPLEGLCIRLFLSHLCGKFGIGEALSYNLRPQPTESVRIADDFAVSVLRWRVREAHNDRLIALLAMLLDAHFTLLVRVADFAANEGFVDLYFAAESGCSGRDVVRSHNGCNAGTTRIECWGSSGS